MKKLHVCIIDLINNTSTSAVYPRLVFANYMSIMPQVVGVWCKQEGHDVTYIFYAGFKNIISQIPDNIDIAFINAFTFTAHLAYAISNFLKSKGIVTVLGGPHARCYPEDACKYFNFVLGLTDKKLINELLRIYNQSGKEGVFMSNEKQPIAIPSVEERWEFIEKIFSYAPLLKVVPLISSFGCPYKCDFCLDSFIPFQQLGIDFIKEDLRFILRKMKPPRVSWYDPNFGVKFNSVMNAIEEVVPSNSIEFIAECNLSVLTEKNVTRLKKNGFKLIMPGIESWFDYGRKSGVRNNTGIEKVRLVSDHLNMVQGSIPSVQANMILGIDADEGTAPFELTKRFIDLSPGIYPSFALLNAYGRGAPANIEYQRDNRVLPIPFHIMRSVHILNIRPKNYSWLDFYEYTIDLLKYSFSKKAIYKRFCTIKDALPRWLTLALSLSVGGFGKIKFYRNILNNLKTDPHFRDFYEQKTTEIPRFFVELIKKDLGPLWSWLPEGALNHDPNAYLKSIT